MSCLWAGFSPLRLHQKEEDSFNMSPHHLDLQCSSFSHVISDVSALLILPAASCWSFLFPRCVSAGFILRPPAAFCLQISSCAVFPSVLLLFLLSASVCWACCCSDGPSSLSAHTPDWQASAGNNKQDHFSRDYSDKHNLCKDRNRHAWITD